MGAAVGVGVGSGVGFGVGDGVGSGVGATVWEGVGDGKVPRRDGVGADAVEQPHSISRHRASTTDVSCFI